MSKLQKFYGAQCTDSKKDSREKPVIIPAKTPAYRLPALNPSLEKEKEEDSLGAVLAELKLETESHLNEICGKIQLAITHRQQSLQEMLLLKNNIGELQHKLKVMPEDLAAEVRPLLTKIDHNLSVLSKMFSC